MSAELIYELKSNLFEDEKIEKELCDVLEKTEMNPSVPFIENVKRLQTNVNEMGDHYPLLDHNFFLFILENQDKIMKLVNEVQQTSNIFPLTYFGIETLRRKYLLKTHVGYQESIDNFLIRVSLYIWQSNLNAFQRTYAQLRQGDYIFATPVLFNAGTVNPQMASCFLLGNEDSIEGIFDSVKEVAKISKLSGGVGLHIHNIRSSGSYIHGTNGQSQGIIPMLRVYNNVARYVDQGGGKRNGSFAVYLEPWHSDVFAWLQLKKNIGSEEVRARDLFYALWVPNLFMESVIHDSDWYLMNPSVSKNLSNVYGKEFEQLYMSYVEKNLYTKKIKARELWTEITRIQIETGSPYILYKDRANQLSNQKNLGTIQSSNLCCEIIQYSDPKTEIAVCNLSSISLPRFVEENPKVKALHDIEIITKEDCFFCHLLKYFLQKNKVEYTEYSHTSDYGIMLSNREWNSYPQVFRERNVFVGGFEEMWIDYLQPVFNFNRLADIVGNIVENLNQVIDLNKYPLEKAKTSNMNHRPMGIGVQGLANVFHELLIPYDSPKARELNRQIFETMYYFALQKSCSIAKQKGSYRTFQGSPLSSGLFHFDLYDEKYPYKFKYDWDPLRQEIKQYGTRNSLLIALMPTASTSQILGNVESFECLTSNFYTRRTLSGEFYVVNRTLQNIMKACHLWNENQKEELIFNKGSILHFKNIPTRIKDVFRTVWEISQKNLIDMSADRGYFIDQSQSFNIYLNEPNMELLNKIHFYGYKKGLKTGSYYVRQRAIASAQNFSISSEKEKEFMECENCSA